jgi:ribosomal protein S11
LHKKKRIALIYFISTKNNTIVTIIDLLTKKTIDSYSSGAAIAEENFEEPVDVVEEELPGQPVKLGVVAQLEEVSENRKLTKKEKRELQEGKQKENEETEEKSNKIPRSYRRRVQQSGRLFGHDLRNRFINYLAKFKKKYGVFLNYKFIAYFKGPSRVRFIILREFLEGNPVKIIKLGDLTQTPHNGCRGKKERRTRAKKKPKKIFGRKLRRNKKIKKNN